MQQLSNLLKGPFGFIHHLQLPGNIQSEKPFILIKIPAKKNQKKLSLGIRTTEPGIGQNVHR
jgi:hypothetical protein